MYVYKDRLLVVFVCLDQSLGLINSALFNCYCCCFIIVSMIELDLLFSIKVKVFKLT